MAQNSTGTVVSWDTVPEAVSYDVIRGLLSNVSAGQNVYDLGPVVCLEDDSPDESTVGSEDHEIPASGEVFFYLVEYFDGVSSSYGTESSGKPRAPGSGACSQGF